MVSERPDIGSGDEFEFVGEPQVVRESELSGRSADEFKDFNIGDVDFVSISEIMNDALEEQNFGEEVRLAGQSGLVAYVPSWERGFDEEGTLVGDTRTYPVRMLGMDELEGQVRRMQENLEDNRESLDDDLYDDRDEMISQLREVLDTLEGLRAENNGVVDYTVENGSFDVVPGKFGARWMEISPERYGLDSDYDTAIRVEATEYPYLHYDGDELHIQVDGVTVQSYEGVKDFDFSQEGHLLYFGMDRHNEE